jgi:hydroxymethylbilane synthase
VQPLRGNITTRLGRVADGELDGVVIAVAGLLRLRPRVPGVVVTPLEHGEMLHAPAQGVLAVECRRDDGATRRALAAVDDGPTRTETTAERELLLQLQGGCTAPIGAHAELRQTATGEDRLVLLGMLADPSGTRLHRASHEVGADEATLLGRAMAATLLEAGGEAVLASLREDEQR